MAVKRTRHSREHGGYIIILLVICCILIVAVGLISKKRAKEAQQTAESLPAATSTAETTALPTETDAALPAQTLPAETLAAVPDSTAEPTAPPETQPEAQTGAYSIIADTAHLYLRINREKTVTLRANADGVDLSAVRWSVSDSNIADVDETGLVIGLQQGTCTLYADYGVERLEIPVTVRELSVVDECTYIDGILVANKSYSLPSTYDPGMLPETEAAFDQLTADAAAQGLDIYLGSGYRDYAFQVECYNSMVDAYGKEYADSVSARPGFSEHQTGYTIDCNTIDNTFAETDEGRWLAEHCWEYGFIIRYPQGKEAITGYDYESWHIRYVGVEHAQAIWEQGITLEEYLDIDSVYAE